MMPVSGLGFPPQNVARVVVWEWLNELMCLHGGTLCSTAASSPLCDRSPGKLSKDIDVWISFPEILI